MLFAAWHREDSSGIHFKHAVALSVDPLNNMYVLDAGASEIIKFSRTGQGIKRIGGYGWNSGTFDQPRDIISPNGLDVYVADYGNHRILHFDRELNLQSDFFLSSVDDQTEDSFGFPKSIAYSRFGILYILDGDNNRIIKLNKDGRIEKTFGTLHAGKGSLVAPTVLRMSADDKIYVLDGKSIVVFDLFGNYVRTISGEMVDGITAFAVHDKNLYVLDSCSVVMFDGGGSPKSVADSVIQSSVVDCNSVVDFRIQNGLMYFLTRHSVYIQPLPEGFK